MNCSGAAWPALEDDLVIRRLAALVGHLEEQQIGELLHIVAITHVIVAQHAAIVPELLDKGVEVVFMVVSKEAKRLICWPPAGKP